MYTRLKGIENDDDDLNLTPEDRADVLIDKNRLFEHERLTLNFTTYDMRRRRETIRPKGSTSDIMLLSRDTDETTKVVSPFWYARVIRMFHVQARLRSKGDPKLERVYFLWIRWFGRAVEDPFGDRVCRLERVRFISREDNSPQFGFIDPALVVRAVHLIPAFRYGCTDGFLKPSRLARIKHPDDIRNDWESFYINK